MLNPIEGCEYCGERIRGHGNTWHPAWGWHGFVAPTAETRQRREQAIIIAGRMRATLAARTVGGQDALHEGT